MLSHTLHCHKGQPGWPGVIPYFDAAASEEDSFTHCFTHANKMLQKDAHPIFCLKITVCAFVKQLVAIT